MPVSQFLKIEILWLDSEGNLMTPAEFSFYIRGPWRYARDQGLCQCKWNVVRNLVSGMANVSSKYGDRLVEQICHKYGVLSWADKSHNLLNIHGVSRVHSGLKRFQEGNENGEEVDLERIRRGSKKGQKKKKVLKKKKKKKKDSCARFETFWKSYPRKVNKQQARKMWERAQEKDGASTEQLQKAVEHFAAERALWEKADKETKKYTPHAATWLNQGRWKEYVDGMADAPPKEPPTAQLNQYNPEAMEQAKRLAGEGA